MPRFITYARGRKPLGRGADRAHELRRDREAFAQDCGCARQARHQARRPLRDHAWNTARHVESWYGITGIGAIYHTLKPRLFLDQIVYIVNHAEDKVLFFDITFASLVEQIAPRCPASSCMCV